MTRVKKISDKNADTNLNDQILPLNPSEKSGEREKNPVT